MKVGRAIAVAAVVALLAPGRVADARPEGPRDAPCTGVEGGADGRTLRGALCIGAGGHVLASVGGNVPAVCGTVVVTDVNVLDGPTAGTGPGTAAADCPYPGWSTEVHDPFIATETGVHYLFSTAPGIPIRRSTDLRTWEPVGRVFAADLPPWATTVIPGATIPWAPDVSYFGGTWHVYYAISTFASKVSAIGMATSPTLDPASPAYGWTDHGVVVRSDLFTDHNAIDPSVLVQGDAIRLTWGSFWGGIKQARIDPATGQLVASALPITVASRLVPTWGVEAPTLIERDGSYYLFTSFDSCCRGSLSTYNVRVGRATSPEGPFLDASGVPLLLGGGTPVLAADGSRRGPGHQAVVRDGDRWFLAFHYYDADRDGTATLGILPIQWSADGWPSVDWTRL